MSRGPVRRPTEGPIARIGRQTEEKVMRKLVVTTFVTMDGVMQAPGGPGEDPSGGFSYEGWLVPHFDEALGEQMNEWFAGAQDFLLGRTTYEIFYASWPKMISDDPVSQKLNFNKKYVASRTLSSVEWETAELLQGDVGDAVRKLKAEDGGELQVHGSAGLIQTLLAEDVIDELRLVVFPVSLGQGKRLFGDGTVPRTWKLTSSKASSTGALIVSYERAGEVETGSVGPEYE
jgi:dihydrofolate reductase